MNAQDIRASRVELSTVPLDDLLGKFAAGGHKPGSGSASAMQGLISCALVKTVITLTKERPRYKSKWKQLLRIEDSVKKEIEPSLWDAFRDDSTQFDKVIIARQKRDNETDSFERREFARESLHELHAASEIPIIIAEKCLFLAEQAISVFDHGFKAARGDSEVAADSALSGASGAISIVFLNLKSFSGEKQSKDLLDRALQLEERLNSLKEELRNRVKELRDAAIQSNKELRLDSSLLRDSKATKGKYSDTELEKIARNVQFELWRLREEIWQSNEIEHENEMLDPRKVFQLLGYDFEEVPSLQQHAKRNFENDIIGYIDKRAKYAAVSRKASLTVRRFTAAHELGHALLHSENTQFRDRGLDGTHESRSQVEHEADKFATFFLMPRKLVRETFFKMFGTDRFEINNATAFGLAGVKPRKLLGALSSTRDLSLRLASAEVFAGRPMNSLAGLFRVSNTAMAIRIEELGLVDRID